MTTAENDKEQPNITASFRVDESRSQQRPTERPKVEVKGKRKVWGTLSTTTVAAVKNAIKIISKVEGLEIKRKYIVSKRLKKPVERVMQLVFKFQNGGLLSQGKKPSWINWQRIGTQSKFKPTGLSSQFSHTAILQIKPPTHHVF